jgi:hypothetical protein
MTQERIRPAGEHSGKAAPVTSEARVPDGVDAPVKAMESSGANGPRDGSVGVTDPVELPDRYDTVLPGGQFSQFQTSRPSFRSHSDHKLGRG